MPTPPLATATLTGPEKALNAAAAGDAALGQHVRRARREDAGAIEAMLRAVHHESSVYRAMPIDDRKLKSFIAKAIDSGDHAVLLHEGVAGIDGLFISMLVQQFFTFEVTAMDIVFYVRPERRGTRAAARLWRALRNWAKTRGAKAIVVGSTTDIDPGVTAKFYQGMGLREIGGVFHMRIG
jgi:GNAT superfamily N-acetyltransferase